MKKLLFLLFFISVGKLAFAQQEPYFPDMRVWGLSLDSYARYIFSDTAFIRAMPSTKQAAVDTLFAGDNITVTDVTDKQLTIRGITGPWLRISYDKYGEQRTGYVWQGLISCTPMRRGDIKFIYGVERRADSTFINASKAKDTIPRFFIRLKVVQNGAIIAKSSVITPDDESAGYCTGKVMSGMGLTNVQQIVVLTFSGEACGIPTYDYYFAFTKDSQLVRFPDKTNIGDADAYYHSEEFTFPNEKGGQPDMVIWNMQTEEATDKVGKDGLYILKTTEKGKVTYIWDPENKRITKQKK
ncbi:hypothetical protein CLV59_11295 [Chitinophaga dinghuensis]|uniref:SH3 domain-containing protein n=1 Tax=Chitinophaga dinghuensis TaxID=1539050 RepID=A0A327VIS4_9BACT|nr:SH3 domain-containing protein [Chitinophaga dinghuensis]RAJ73754.1 hypothetical protein CLV59_11295 [Chitinophaga dinghuensis]